jgi:hypothetical protein
VVTVTHEQASCSPSATLGCVSLGHGRWCGPAQRIWIKVCGIAQTAPPIAFKVDGIRGRWVWGLYAGSRQLLPPCSSHEARRSDEGAAGKRCCRWEKAEGTRFGRSRTAATVHGRRAIGATHRTLSALMAGFWYFQKADQCARLAQATGDALLRAELETETRCCGFK